MRVPASSKRPRVRRALPSASRKEDLEMWFHARDYYLSRGWDGLAEAADRQINRIADALAHDFVTGRSSNLLGTHSK